MSDIFSEYKKLLTFWDICVSECHGAYDKALHVAMWPYYHIVRAMESFSKGLDEGRNKKD